MRLAHAAATKAAPYQSGRLPESVMTPDRVVRDPAPNGCILLYEPIRSLRAKSGEGSSNLLKYWRALVDSNHRPTA